MNGKAVSGLLALLVSFGITVAVSYADCTGLVGTCTRNDESNPYGGGGYCCFPQRSAWKPCGSGVMVVDVDPAGCGRIHVIVGGLCQTITTETCNEARVGPFDCVSKWCPS